MDGDGLADIAFSAFWRREEAGDYVGRVYAYSGASGGLLGVFDGEAPGDLFGFSVSGAGDIDGDGRAEILVGAHLHDGPAGPDSGWIYLFSGATGEQLSTEDGPSSQAFFGYALACAGDVNGDGLEELPGGRHEGLRFGPRSGLPLLGGLPGRQPGGRTAVALAVAR
ncbi:MAG: integrin alpha [Planctomycetota bacterium]